MVHNWFYKSYVISIVFYMQKIDTETLFQLINELIPTICKSNDTEPPSSTQNVSLENDIYRIIYIFGSFWCDYYRQTEELIHLWGLIFI